MYILEATYAGPDAKAVPAAVPGVDVPPAAPARAPPFLPVVPPQPVASPSTPPANTPFKTKPLNSGGEEQTQEAALDEGDLDEDDLENSMSLAAIEAELKPKVLETFDTIADTFKRLRRLQDQDIHNKLRNELLSPAQGRKYKKLKKVIVAEVKSLRLNQARIEALVEQLYDINKRLAGHEGRLMRLAERSRRRSRGLPPELPRRRTRSALAQPRVEALGQGLEEFRGARRGSHQGVARQHLRAGDRDRPRDR